MHEKSATHSKKSLFIWALLIFAELFACSTQQKAAPLSYFLLQKIDMPLQWHAEFKEAIQADFSVDELLIHHRYKTILDENVDLYSRSQAIKYVPYDIDSRKIRLPKKEQKP